MQFYNILRETFHKISLLPLILFPVLIVLAAVIARFKGRGVPFLKTFGALHILSFALLSLSFELSEAVFYQCAFILLSVAVYPVSKRREKREKKKKENPVDAFAREYLAEESANEEEPLPKSDGKKKILVGDGGMSGGEDVYRLDRERISLNHAIGVAQKLRRAKLTVPDRLETDGIYRTLMTFRAKNALSKEEISSLNGYLATLLKLMAKYSL